ncbi:hypothetical protein Neosp_008968 [[Neocosmospora] mangrovei]
MTDSDEVPPPRPNDVPSPAARRALMNVVFKQHGPYTPAMMDATRAEAVRTICLALRGHKKTRVSQEYFEYLVDLTIWDNWMFFNKLPGTGVPFPECPWAETRPDPSDMTGGLSSIYAQWLSDDFPAEKHDNEAAAKASETPAAVSSEQPPVAAKPQPEPESIAEPETIAAEPVAAQSELKSKAAEDKPSPEPEVTSAPSPEPASYDCGCRVH